jgi:hypothetical protein
VERKSRTVPIVFTAVAAVTALGGGIGAAAWALTGGGNSALTADAPASPAAPVATAPSGYNDPVTLAQGIESKAPNVTVTCIHAAGPQFTCYGKGTDGSTAVVTATVAADGNSYITNSGN